MFVSGDPATPHIIALVELDMQKMRLRIRLSRKAIRYQLREMGIVEHSSRIQPSGGERNNEND
jgi:hypothetical protein